MSRRQSSGRADGAGAALTRRPAIRSAKAWRVNASGPASGGHRCWFERADLKVHLGVDANFRPATKAHPAFIVEGLPSLVDRLRAAGYRVMDDEPLDDFDRSYVDDPFGNRIELMEPR
jgi:hypothetical protein